MTAEVKQDSNTTGLSVALETTHGVLPNTPIWIPVEPNSYKNFGGQYKKVARQPINASRQRKKGSIVDLDASGSFQSDLTQTSLVPFIEGVMYSDFRTKDELATSAVTTTNYVVAANGDHYVAGDIFFAKGFTKAGNNGRKVATGSSSTTVLATGLAAETTVGTISRVGFKFAAADVAATISGTSLILTSTAKNMTDFGIIPGEWVYVGGDTAGSTFPTAGANGFGRVASIVGKVLTLDKTEFAVAADTGALTTLELYFGRVSKNETSASGLIKRRTLQFERTLNKADSSDTYVQAEYLPGSTMDELDLTFNTADKITFDLTTVSQTHATVNGATGPKSGTRQALVEADVFNTTQHLKRFRLGIVGAANSLFAFVTQGALMIKNNNKANKALSVLGSFDQSAGSFEVSATVTAYFVDVAAVAAIPNNSDVTLDAIICQNNAGIAIEIPLIALADGRLNVVLNEPITLPLTIDAATAIKLNSNMDFTAMLVFFDYLPTVAMPAVST